MNANGFPSSIRTKISGRFHRSCRCCLVSLYLLLVVIQIWYGITFGYVPRGFPSNEELRAAPAALPSNNNNYMSACLIVRNDNQLLARWVAYHYTVLPLRHLIVGVDENSTEDPMEVKRLWNGTDLIFDIWHPEDFTQGINYSSSSDTPKLAYLKRQHALFRQCLQHFRRKRRGWVALVDTDEYIQLNPLDDVLVKEFQNIITSTTTLAESVEFFNVTLRRFMEKSEMEIPLLHMAPNETLLDRVKARMQLRTTLGLDRTDIINWTLSLSPSSSVETTPRSHRATTLHSPTVLDVLEDYSSQHGTLPCHSMSRRRYSVVMDNFTTLATTICRPPLDPRITAAMNVSKLHTIQFLYHVPPHTFRHNKWSKVLIDVRRISYSQLARVEERRKTHAPLDECPGAYLPDIASLIRVNHYANPWSDYMTRRDAFGDHIVIEHALWSWFAHARDFCTCGHIHNWLNEFVQTFGMENAKQMLLLS